MGALLSVSGLNEKSREKSWHDGLHAPFFYPNTPTHPYPNTPTYPCFD